MKTQEHFYCPLYRISGSDINKSGQSGDSSCLHFYQDIFPTAQGRQTVPDKVCYHAFDVLLRYGFRGSHRYPYKKRNLSTLYKVVKKPDSVGSHSMSGQSSLIYLQAPPSAILTLISYNSLYLTIIELYNNLIRPYVKQNGNSGSPLYFKADVYQPSALIVYSFSIF